MIYPRIYTRLPNSRWLHNAALRCVRSVQLDAYMWAKVGQKGLKMGSSVPFEHPKCSKIIFGKTYS